MRAFLWDGRHLDFFARVTLSSRRAELSRLLGSRNTISLDDSHCNTVGFACFRFGFGRTKQVVFV